MFNLIMIWYFIRKIVLCLEIWALNESDVKKYFYFFFNIFKFYVYGMKLLFYLEIERLVYWYWMGFLYDFI